MREDCQRCCYCPREVTVLDICGNLVQNMNVRGKKEGRKGKEGRKEGNIRNYGVFSMTYQGL